MNVLVYLSSYLDLKESAKFYLSELGYKVKEWIDYINSKTNQTAFSDKELEDIYEQAKGKTEFLGLSDEDIKDLVLIAASHIAEFGYNVSGFIKEARENLGEMLNGVTDKDLIDIYEQAKGKKEAEKQNSDTKSKLEPSKESSFFNQYLKKNLRLKIGVAVILVLMLTNPSMRQFKEYVGNSGAVTRRKSNWMIFSIYESDKKSKYEVYRTYLAGFNNFYQIDSSSKLYLESVHKVQVIVDKFFAAVLIVHDNYL